MAIEVRILEATDHRSSFDSGDRQLDLFFDNYAGQTQFRHQIGTTYVAVESAAILGFATVRVGHWGSKVCPHLKKKLADYPLPILRLARLAVDRNARGKGVGEHLLRAVFSIARDLREKVGCAGVLVDAKPGVENYYSRYGFIELEVMEGMLEERPVSKKTFLPLSVIVRAARAAPPKKSS